MRGEKTFYFDKSYFDHRGDRGHEKQKQRNKITRKLEKKGETKDLKGQYLLTDLCLLMCVQKLANFIGTFFLNWSVHNGSEMYG